MSNLYIVCQEYAEKHNLSLDKVLLAVNNFLSSNIEDSEINLTDIFTKDQWKRLKDKSKLNLK